MDERPIMAGGYTNNPFLEDLQGREQAGQREGQGFGDLGQGQGQEFHQNVFDNVPGEHQLRGAGEHQEERLQEEERHQDNQADIEGHQYQRLEDDTEEDRMGVVEDDDDDDSTDLVMDSVEEVIHGEHQEDMRLDNGHLSDAMSGGVQGHLQDDRHDQMDGLGEQHHQHHQQHQEFDHQAESDDVMCEEFEPQKKDMVEPVPAEPEVRHQLCSLTVLSMILVLVGHFPNYDLLYFTVLSQVQC